MTQLQRSLLKPAKPDEKKITLDYWIINGNEANQVIELMKQWNAENPNIQVNAQAITGSPDEYFQKLSAAFASGKGTGFVLNVAY